MFTDDKRITAGLRARRTLLSIWIAATVLVACVAMTTGLLSSGHAASMLASRLESAARHTVSKS